MQVEPHARVLVQTEEMTRDQYKIIVAWVIFQRKCYNEAPDTAML